MKVDDKVWFVFEDTKTLPQTRASVVKLTAETVFVRCDGQKITSSIKFNRQPKDAFPMYEKTRIGVKPKFRLEPYSTAQ